MTSTSKSSAGFSVALLVAVLRLLSIFPIQVLRCFGNLYGTMLYLCGSRAAKTTKRNIELCYPQLDPNDQKRLTRRSLRATGCSMFEMAPLWFWGQARLKRLEVQFDGEELLKSHLARGPVLAILPHWGNWETSLFVLGGKFSTTVLFDDRRLAAFTDRVSQARSRFGFSMVSVARHGLRRMLQAFDDNELVIILPDQVPTRGRHILSEFMGVPAQTTALVHALIQKKSPSVLILSFQRVSRGFYVRAEPVQPLVLHSDVDHATLALNQEIERIVQRDPAQYQWEYKRFRRVPNRDVYANPKLR